MFKDIGHPFAEGETVYDVTFENVQAGLRTDFLFRLANQRGGMVIGTADLSELALGWATYGVGDQMSHYAVNAGVPKTLVQHVIRWVISHGELEEANDVLGEILLARDHPRTRPDGRTARSRRRPRTPVGPYALHDFTLSLSCATVSVRARSPSWPRTRGRTRRPEPGLRFPRRRAGSVHPRRGPHWLEVFLKRFFAFQFKRSAIPNGPKVSSSGTMSPRVTGGCPATPRARPGWPRSSGTWPEA